MSMKILVVDDNEDIKDIVELMIESEFGLLSVGSGSLWIKTKLIKKA